LRTGALECANMSISRPVSTAKSVVPDFSHARPASC